MDPGNVPSVLHKAPHCASSWSATVVGGLDEEAE